MDGTPQYPYSQLRVRMLRDAAVASRARVHHATRESVSWQRVTRRSVRVVDLERSGPHTVNLWLEPNRHNLQLLTGLSHVRCTQKPEVISTLETHQTETCNLDLCWAKLITHQTWNYNTTVKSLSHKSKTIMSSPLSKLGTWTHQLQTSHKGNLEWTEPQKLHLTVNLNLNLNLSSLSHLKSGTLTRIV